MNRRTALVVAATALVVIIGIALWMNLRDRPTDPLYLQLQAIAAEAPLTGSAPGVGVDVSDKICPLVDAEKLSQMELNIGNPLPPNIRTWVVQFSAWVPCLDPNGNRALAIGIDPQTKQCHASATLQRACQFSL